MTVDDYLHLFRATLRPEVLYACRYLEAQGLLLYDDFGFVNAVQKATNLTLEVLEEEMTSGS